MLAFIDESGNPHPNDASSRPVIAAVCIDEKDSRAIGRRTYAMKHDLLGASRADVELKGKKLLKEKTYQGSIASRIFAEEFFAALGDWNITVFATIMQAPFTLPAPANGLLETRFRYLLQRIKLLATEQDVYANILFDGRGSQFRALSRNFSGYLFRSNEGKASVHIADTPAFVDSATSAGIQITDMCAYVIRVYHERRLFEGISPPGDEYLHAISRWYRTIQRLTCDLSTAGGELRFGLYQLAPGIR